MSSKTQLVTVGLEKVVIDFQADDASYLENNVINSLTWSGVNVVVPDRGTKKSNHILTNVNGHVMAGEFL
jgi:hypothetical protein